MTRLGLVRSRSRLRRAPAVAAGGGGGDVFTLADFTYLGAFRVQRIVSSDWDSLFGDGVAFVERAEDATSSKHLISAAYNPTPNHMLYEVRIPAALYPGGNTDLSQYNLATVVKAYGDVYGSPSKKKVMYNPGSGCESTAMTAQLDGGLGLHVHSDGKLYVGFGYGYSACPSWCFLRATLNYAAGTGTAEGPWGFSDQSWKAMMQGFVTVPAAYASTYLGGRDIAIVGGGYRSLVDSCDTAMGGNATAFDSTALGAADSYGTSLPLFGSWPYEAAPGAGKNRWTRPENATSVAVDSWGVDKFSWNDRVYGMCWPQGHPTKRGILVVGTTGLGRQQYLSSQVPPSRHAHWLAIVDPDDATPVSSTPRYDVLPTEIALYQFPTIDYTQVQYAGGASKSVSGITSIVAPRSGNANCTVSCTGHGLADGNYLEIFGASLSEYNAIWEIPTGGVINANSFTIRNTSDGTNWSGNSPTGTITLKQVANSFDRPFGATDDPVARRVYIPLAVTKGVNGVDSFLMVHVFSY